MTTEKALKTSYITDSKTCTSLCYSSLL